MKRNERHRLKENEIEHFAREARERFESRRRETLAIIALVVVVGSALIGYFAWRERVNSRAQALLAEALTVQQARVGPPADVAGVQGPSYPTERERAQAALTKFKVAADAYPNTDAAIFARYQEAATWMTLGNPEQAATAYKQVIDRAGDRIHGQMARLGLAEAQARAGQYDLAINAYKELAQRKDGQLPIDGILIQLARTYLDAGKRADAQQTFNRLVEEYPESPFSADARRELANLKKTT